MGERVGMRGGEGRQSRHSTHDARVSDLDRWHHKTLKQSKTRQNCLSRQDQTIDT